MLDQMSFLLDTDVVTAYNKRNLPLKLARWLQVNEGDSYLSVVSIAEMHHGLPGVEDKDHVILSERVAQTEIILLESMEPLDVGVLVEWKRLLAQLKKINRTMTCEDSLLAATALARGHKMATGNTRHFAPAEQFGLRVENSLV
jgi:predicted nucleic acid-binding protein